MTIFNGFHEQHNSLNVEKSEYHVMIDLLPYTLSKSIEPLQRIFATTVLFNSDEDKVKTKEDK